MTSNNPRPRIWYRRACTLGLAAFLVLAGCKSKDGNTGGRGNDPLVGGPGRIPPQNVPVPDRGGIGKGKSDPLLGSPTGKPGDKTGVGYSDDPERFKGTFLPGAATTPAALAGKSKDGDELKIDDRQNRVPLLQTGAVLPTGSTEPAHELESLFAELEKYGVKQADRVMGRENSQYVFRASVPSSFGGKRQYSGIGQTQTQAVKQLLDQVIADRK